MTLYPILAVVSFAGMILSGIWPKWCLSKFQGILRDKGEDPNQKFGSKKMKELDPALYRSWKIGFIVSSIFTASFSIFGILAFFKR